MINCCLNRYNEARTLFETIFGPKFHVDFPREYLDNRAWGEGFWESQGDYHYSHPGIDLLAETGGGVRSHVVTRNRFLAFTVDLAEEKRGEGRREEKGGIREGREKRGRERRRGKS